VSHSDSVESEQECLFKEEIELHEIVAENIRIGCPPECIFSVDIVDDPPVILLSVVKSIERESEVFCNSTSLFKINTSGTSWIVLIEIVDHIATRYIMSLFPEEPSRDSRIYTSGESDEDTSHIYPR
jgi:hypothetical protein